MHIIKFYLIFSIITASAMLDINENIPTFMSQSIFESSKNLTADIEVDYPSWSPIGDVIAFHLNDGKSQSIYTINLKTSKISRLTSSTMDAAPFWSPDGKKIGFHSKRDGNWDIYTINSDGSNLQRVTHDTGMNYFPASWSPDGKSIAYMSNSDGDFEIYTIEIESLKIKKLTDNDVLDGVPSWSQDGKSILFHSTRHGRYLFQPYLMSSDGSNPERVLTNNEQSFMGQYSPKNATKMIYLQGNVRSKYDNWEIMLYDFKTKQSENLTNNKVYDFKPSWSPDGKQIVYTSRVKDKNHLFIMDIETRRVKKIY